MVALESFSVLTCHHGRWPAIVVGNYGCVDPSREYKSMGISASLYSSLLPIFISARYSSLVTSLAYNPQKYIYIYILGKSDSFSHCYTLILHPL